MNKWKRTLEVDNVCKLCGMGEEDEFHAIVSCTKSKALRHEMKGAWDLPSEDKFRFTGVDWLQNLLGPCSQEARTKILILLWRCWFLRDDCIHSTGKELVSRSALFLQQYVEELRSCDAALGCDPNNKQKASHAAHDLARGAHRGFLTGAVDMHGENPESSRANRWCPPDAGTVKLNSDAAFQADSGDSHAGAVARDHKGLVLMSLSKRIANCNAVEEAEARALLAGLRALSPLYRGPIIAESDCTFVVKELRPGGTNCSAWHSVFADIKEELKLFSEVQIIYSKRDQNKLAHSLAARARSFEDVQMVASIPNDLNAVLAADEVLA